MLVQLGVNAVITNYPDVANGICSARSDCSENENIKQEYLLKCNNDYIIKEHGLQERSKNT